MLFYKSKGYFFSNWFDFTLNKKNNAINIGILKSRNLIINCSKTFLQLLNSENENKDDDENGLSLMLIRLKNSNFNKIVQKFHSKSYLIKK